LDNKTLKYIELEAHRLATKSGEILSSYFPDFRDRDTSRLEIEYKDRSLRDPVTQADKAVQDFLKYEIQKTFPDHGIVSEEEEASDEKSPDVVWVLDPLDGTRNFMYGFPVYATSIGVLDKGIPVAGAVFIPWPNSTNNGRVIHASRNNGLSVDGKSLSIKLTDQVDANSIITLPGSFSKRYEFDNKFISKSGELRMGGSIAYEIIMVALWISQYAMISSAYLWDIVGAVSILIEAGGSPYRLSNSGKFSKTKGDWEPFVLLLESWTSGVTTLKDMRSRTFPMIVAPSSIVDEVNENIHLKNQSISQYVKSLFI
jgi:myo-inositol-1(or 4)-monophosphatase